MRVLAAKLSAFWVQPCSITSTGRRAPGSRPGGL